MRMVASLPVVSVLLTLGLTSADVLFHAPLFSDGMILQRGVGTKVWGSALPNSSVEVEVGQFKPPIAASAQADSQGNWIVSLPKVDAIASTRLVATNPAGPGPAAVLKDVAFGDVLLCGGQSNMGFGMCGAQSKSQTPQQALDALPPLRFFFQAGSGPNGGAGKSHCKTSAGKPSVTPSQEWFTANASNAGGASAVCMLTAQYLYQALGGKVPVGAVESCIGGTNVEPWTPPSGSLWTAHMKPLLPMRFSTALWDQGEADAKRTNSTWYSVEFPTMIKRWRSAFQTSGLPFFYVELCTEYGAEEPKEPDFWLAQRSALSLPSVGFAVTTDIQRALHPPDKQDVAQRLSLEVLRQVYGQSVTSRGPELVGVDSSAGDSQVTLSFKFSNASMSSHAGVFVGDEAACNGAHDSVATDPLQAFQSLNYTIDGSTVHVRCASVNGMVQINSDKSQCFLYGTSGLPAPPVQHTCKSSKTLII